MTGIISMCTLLTQTSQTMLFHSTFIIIIPIIFEIGLCEYRRSIVHFDLKGAPPRLNYFKDLLTSVKNLGATGIMIEWEDMFPYAGELSKVINRNSYTEEEVFSILEHAQSIGLEVIPLVQTLAHMEWILKTAEYENFREDQRYPMAACIGNPKAVSLILDSVNQIMNFHKKFNTRYIHIGADEAFQIGVCEADKKVLIEKFNNDTLRMIFNHFQQISLNITERFPGSEILMWYDEFKNVPHAVIKEYELDKLVIPVVWKYTTNLDKDLPSELWQNLSYSFREVWGGSAFKGADGANKYWNRLKPYILNNKEWYIQNEKHSRLFTTFDSLILTGWQRYDHFASLCELWPTSMISLAMNLIVISKLHIDSDAANSVINTLNCPPSTTLEQLVAGSDRCQFPGYKVRDAVRDFIQLKTFFENSTWVHNRENGWLQASHLRLLTSNPYYINAIGKSYERTLNKLNTIVDNLRLALNEIFYSDVAEEFLEDYIWPFYNDLLRKKMAVTNIDAKKTYLPRPWFNSRDL